MNSIKETWQQYAKPAATSSSQKTRTGAYINACLILRREDKVALSLRQNTGYADGFYGLISGHVEDGESATTAILREAYEEAGIRILPENLKVVHVCHRKTNRLNVDMFFECSTWSDAICNKEPEKCAALEFISLNQLPENTIEHIAQVLRMVSCGEFYSECGWEV